MTAADDNAKNSGDSFDLPGFKPKGPGKPKPEGDAKKRIGKFSQDAGKPYAPRKPYGGAGGDRPARPPKGEGDKPFSKEGKFGKSRDSGYGSQNDSRGAFRAPSYDKPKGPRAPYGASSGPRKPYGGAGGGTGGDDRGPRKSYGAGGDRPARSFEGGSRPSYGDKPAWKKDRPPYKPRGEGDSRPPYGGSGGSSGPRKPYGSAGGDDRPRRSFDGPKPYGQDRPPRREYGPPGDKPAWKKDRPAFKPRGEGDSRPPYKPRDSYSDRKPDYASGPRQDFAPAPFESLLSPEVKKFLPLLTEKGRYKESRFIIEGAKNVSDVALLSPDILHVVLVSDGFEDAELQATLHRQRVRTLIVPAASLNALCGTETPQGVVAVANFGALRPDWSTISAVTLLDGVQDPGNLGSILRTSAALGMDAVVLGKGTCDPYNPKVVRSSAASLLRLPLETGEDLASKIQFLRLKGFSVVATSPHAKVTLEQAKLRRKVALLFGNEGGGVGENLIDQADEVVRIPMKGKVESLNVAVAHGLLTYDLMRLRK